MPDFIIGSPQHFFSDVVIPQYQRFVQSNSDVGAAVCAIVMTYHLYEWATGQKFRPDSFPTLYPNDLNLLERFDLARRVSNGVKHANPKIETVTQTGFSSGFSFGFARPLNIVQDDGSKVSVDELLRDLIEFWERQDQAGWPNAPT
ncbi:hypothetical protein J7426_22995 [Tropicibacter sp. R16_0]|uniref:hypothetical protein n=1 Tax=Tropicibacter sp. R16_0 TaxID=2821102 RepID=UPI001ADBB1E6|nr:hypothetical protein [Tropicibacter sp. R16_0]MBO9453148.1 hypothetical protein [Tropicibacter sp. R16_0]